MKPALVSTVAGPRCDADTLSIRGCHLSSGDMDLGVQSAQAMPAGEFNLDNLQQHLSFRPAGDLWRRWRHSL